MRKKRQPTYRGEDPPPSSGIFTAITIHAYQSLPSIPGTKCAWPWCICLTSKHKQGSNINMVIEVQTTEGAAFPFGDHKPIYRSPTLPDPLHLGEETPWRLGIGNGCLVMLNTFSKKDHSFLQLLLKLKPKKLPEEYGCPRSWPAPALYHMPRIHCASHTCSITGRVREDFAQEWVSQYCREQC